MIRILISLMSIVISDIKPKIINITIFGGRNYMKVTKLVVGILQILIAVVILVQSCSVGASHAMEDKTSDFGGTFGIIAAILFLATGIVYIATRKKQKNLVAILLD